MGNALIGYPNRGDQGIFSGGSWVAAAPLTCLQDRQLANVARSTDLATGSTQFDCDLGIARSLRVVGLINHNLSLQAQYRLRISQSGSFSDAAFDSGWGLVWPMVYAVGSVEWEEDNWWSLQYTADQISGVTWNLIKALPANILGRYVRLEISDPLNPNGFIQAGRFFAGPAWQAGVNLSKEADLGWETETEVDSALSGAEYFDRRYPYRVIQCAFNWLSRDEALTNPYEIIRRAGIDGEILFVYDPDDTVHAIRRQFLGRMRKLTPLGFRYVSHAKQAFEIKELLP